MKTLSLAFAKFSERSALCRPLAIALIGTLAFAGSLVPPTSAQTGGSTEGPEVEADLYEVTPQAAIPATGDVPSPLAPTALCPQTVLPANGSTSVGGQAPSARFRGVRSVYLITPSELLTTLQDGASPTAIGWHYTVAPGVAANGTLAVYLQNTGDTVFSKPSTFAAAIAGMTLVHNAPTTLPNSTSPFDIPFSGGDPFTYTSGGLYVAFDWQYPVGTLSGAANVATNTSLANGIETAQSATTAPAPDPMTPGNFRPETRLTTNLNNDRSVDFVIALGALPKGIVNPQSFQAIVTNRGSAATNVPVTLTITGADSFTDTQIIPTMAQCNGQSIVSFAPFTQAALGLDTVTVSVPDDDIPANSANSKPLNSNMTQYSYKHPGTTATGGTGVSGNTAGLVAKFTTNSPTTVKAVNLEFQASGAQKHYRVAVYGDSGSGRPATSPLYLDATDRFVAAAGPVTITLPSPVPVGPGTFYAGIHQTSTVTVGLSFDAETPVRSGAFYLSIPATPQAWFDESPGNNFKLNIGVTLDRCLVTPTTSNNSPICAGSTLQLSASSVTGAMYSWTGPGGFTSTQQNPSIPNATPANSGVYTVSVNGCASSSSTSATVIADGGSCLCTTNGGTCSGGTCTGTPVVCTAQDQCHEDGVCDRNTGLCSNPVKPDGTTCNDGDVCTNGDACTNGMCTAQMGTQEVDDSVRVTKPSPTGARIEWSDAPGPFNVYRGSRSVGVIWNFNQTCFADTVASPVNDPGMPPAGTSFYYLVTRTASCGESGLGHATDGQTEPNSQPCGIAYFEDEGDAGNDPLTPGCHYRYNDAMCSAGRVFAFGDTCIYNHVGHRDIWRLVERTITGCHQQPPADDQTYTCRHGVCPGEGYCVVVPDACGPGNDSGHCVCN